MIADCTLYPNKLSNSIVAIIAYSLTLSCYYTFINTFVTTQQIGKWKVKLKQGHP